MTILQTRDEIIDKLTAAGIADAATEAMIILRETAGLSATDVHSRPDDELPDDAYNSIQTIIKRRLMREPLQYIYGRWDFMGLVFDVAPGVLIPRPDTEILVEATMRELHDGMRILDLCTGTGCILISLLKYSNDCVGVGVDISAEALAIARRNAETMLGDSGAAGSVLDADGEGKARIRFQQGDLYDALGPTDGACRESREGSELFDIIVTNPPYIASSVIGTLEPEVREHEPMIALDGGADGLDIIRRIIDGASDHLVPGGEIYMEIGYDQGESVSALMRDAGLADVEVIQDYAGLDRVVHARNPIRTL